MPQIGNLSVKLTMDGSRFNPEVKKAEASIDKLKNTTKRASDSTRRHAGSSRRSTAALLELSRGAEDAASQFGTQGLSGAIRGASNNLSQMATVLNPMAGVIVGLGAAVASVLVSQFEKASKKTKKLAEELKKMKEEAVQARIEAGREGAGRAGAGVERAQQADQLLTAKAARDAVLKASQQLDVLRAKDAENARQQKALIERFTPQLLRPGTRKVFGRNGEQVGTQTIRRFPDVFTLRKELQGERKDQFNKEFKAISDRRQKIVNDRFKAQQDVNKFQKRLRQLQGQEKVVNDVLLKSGLPLIGLPGLTGGVGAFVGGTFGQVATKTGQSVSGRAIGTSAIGISGRRRELSLQLRELGLNRGGLAGPNRAAAVGRDRITDALASAVRERERVREQASAEMIQREMLEIDKKMLAALQKLQTAQLVSVSDNVAGTVGGAASSAAGLLTSGFGG